MSTHGAIAGRIGRSARHHMIVWGMAATKKRDMSRDLRVGLREGWATMGRYSYGRPTIVRHDQRCRLSIGSFSSIGLIDILLGGEHRMDWMTTSPLRWRMGLETRDDEVPDANLNVTIGHDVWIGHGATLLSGVEIGNGAVIGAGATVRRSIPPFAIVKGDPASISRYRFDPETCQRLLQLAWWDWPADVIRAAADDLCSTDVAALERWTTMTAETWR